jgi:hypothetical protein
MIYADFAYRDEIPHNRVDKHGEYSQLSNGMSSLISFFAGYKNTTFVLSVLQCDTGLLHTDNFCHCSTSSF